MDSSQIIFDRAADFPLGPLLALIVLVIYLQIPDPAGVRAVITEAHNKFIAVHPEGREVHDQT